MNISGCQKIMYDYIIPLLKLNSFPFFDCLFWSFPLIIQIEDAHLIELINLRFDANTIC